MTESYWEPVLLLNFMERIIFIIMAIIKSHCDTLKLNLIVIDCYLLLLTVNRLSCYLMVIGLPYYEGFHLLSNVYILVILRIFNFSVSTFFYVHYLHFCMTSMFVFSKCFCRRLFFFYFMTLLSWFLFDQTWILVSIAWILQICLAYVIIYLSVKFGPIIKVW